MIITKIESKTCVICNIAFDMYQDKKNHLQKEHNLSFKEYIVQVYYDNILPRCKCGCKKELTFKPLKCGPWFAEYTKNHWIHKNHSASTIKKIKENTTKSIHKKFGVDNVFVLDRIKNKIKSTKLRKYGNENYNNSSLNSLNQRKKFFEKLLTSDRLSNLYIPRFSIDEYNGVAEKKYKFECKKCGNIFIDNMDNGRLPRCIICFPILQAISGQEKEILEYIRSILPKNEIIIENDKTILDNLELDIYIPSKKIAIEYNGLYWHSEISGGKSKSYHINKTNACEKKGIKLIQIFEDEWIYKNPIVKSRLAHILQLSSKSIYARQCDIKIINKNQKSRFLIDNHIQGNDKSKYYVGAFYNNELVSVMTFSENRIALGNKKQKKCFELTRFCTIKSVVGISSRLLKFFIKTYYPEKIISYADRRWSAGNMYESIGFKLIKKTGPNYWYIEKSTNRRLHRFGFNKIALKKRFSNFDNNLTEWQSMQLNGYDRIWDCGSLKYEMNIQ